MDVADGKVREDISVLDGASWRILFSKNTKNRCKDEMKGILNISAEGLSRKYLGLPTYVGKSKAKIFEYLKEKVWRRI
jgi:hypothetical protein